LPLKNGKKRTNSRHLTSPATRHQPTSQPPIAAARRRYPYQRRPASHRTNPPPLTLHPHRGPRGSRP
jgi:hypothetical protein